MSVTSLRALSAGLCLLAAACDLPEAPIVEHRWILPVEETVVAVDELLPSEVTVDPAGTAFDVSVAVVSASETLGDLCGAPCVAVSGQTVPVPPFTASFDASESFPADVLSATIESAQVDIEILNGFSFDPLQGGGTIDIVVTDGFGGTELGRLTLDGATESLAPGTLTTRTLALGEGVVVTGPLTATTAIDVAGGQVATIDTTDALGVSVTADPLLVRSITVVVAGRTVEIESTDVEAEDFEELTDGVVSGTVILDVTNPFGASVDGSIDIGGVTKAFAISDAPSSTLDLTYTGEELRSFLGESGVLLTGSGVVGGGPVTLTPGLQMRIEATLDVIVEFGS